MRRYSMMFYYLNSHIVGNTKDLVALF